jgi:hypothetical protein
MHSRFSLSALAWAVVLAISVSPSVSRSTSTCKTVSIRFSQPILRLRGGEQDDANDDARDRTKDEAIIRQLQTMRNEISAMSERMGSIENVRPLVEF